MEKTILLCHQMVKEIYKQYDASHDMDHIERVLQNGKRLLEKEPLAKASIVELGILLHDVEDAKYKEYGHSIIDILQTLKVEDEMIDVIIENIEAISFSGGNEGKIPSIEAAIMRDADRLDAIGAIGIARAFAFGGAKGHKLYNLEEVPREKMTEEEYRNKEIATVTHFYEKLLKVKDLMVTVEGKRLAEERHRFMELYLDQLHEEIGK